MTLGVTAEKAAPLQETAIVPLPPGVPVDTIDEKPACGFDVTAHGSAVGFWGALVITVNDSLLLVPSLFDTERVYVPAGYPEKLYENVAVFEVGVPAGANGAPPPEKLMVS